MLSSFVLLREKYQIRALRISQLEISILHKKMSNHSTKVYCFCAVRFFFYEWEYRTGTMCPFSSLYPSRNGKE